MNPLLNRSPRGSQAVPGQNKGDSVEYMLAIPALNSAGHLYMSCTFRSPPGVTWWLEETLSDTPKPGSFFFSAYDMASVLQD